MSMLILADDLTGALDSAVGFAGAGREVVVACSPDAVPEALAGAPDVLAINTASREVPPEDAARRCERALSHIDPDRFSVVMKKVDSRLKGNIPAETDVLTRWMQPLRRVACPAIPSMERRVEAGALVGAGVAAPIPVAGRVDGPVEVPAVTTDADLDALVAGPLARTLWIGARGLAFALARASGVAHPDDAALRAPVMIANGSRDPTTRAQIAQLPDDAVIVEAPDGEAPEVPPPGLPLVLSISDGGRGLSGQEAAARFADSTVRLARGLKPAALLICGGESAQAVLDRLGIKCLQVIAELRPGLPLCEVQTDWGVMQIVTKSGGFGEPGLLAGILQETMKDL